MGLAELFLGKENPFAQYVADNRNTIHGAFAGLGQGTDFSSGLGQAALGAQRGNAADDAFATQKKAEAERQQGMNATIEYMRSKGYDDLVSGVEGGGLDMGTAWGEALKRSAPQAAPDPFTLGKGETRYDGMGNPIAQGSPGGPDTVVNNNIGGTDEYYTAFDKLLAGQDAGLIEAGRTARSNDMRLGQLEQHLASAPQGAQGAMVQAAGAFGIDVGGLDDVQAAQALINQMVPGQRPAGSGTMSDADLALFKASLPSIINQPGGNRKIIQTLRAINAYDMQLGDIANQVANRQISPAKGREMAAQVPNPLAGLSMSFGGGTPGAASLPPGVTIREIP